VDAHNFGVELFMANAYARHINGDIHERTIFTYNYVVEQAVEQLNLTADAPTETPPLFKADNATL
jgi:hypothetical protein